MYSKKPFDILNRIPHLIVKSSHLFLPPVWAHSEVETSYSPMAVRPRTPPKTASCSGKSSS